MQDFAFNARKPVVNQGKKPSANKEKGSGEPHRLPNRKSSAGSVILWMLVGVLVLSMFALWVWPEVEKVELNTRLSAADQALAKYRLAVLSYYAARGSVPMDVERREENQGTAPTVFSGSKKSSPKMIYVATSSNLGERLIGAKLLESVTFPFGSRLIEEPTDTQVSSIGETTSPQIYAFPMDYLKERFHKTKLFVSGNSERVAILIVSGLSLTEAEGLQKRIGWTEDSTTGAKQSNCFFIPSTTHKSFAAWIYLTDL